jgi:hypothetical protein
MNEQTLSFGGSEESRTLPGQVDRSTLPRLEGFSLIEEIGRGGNGIVYKAVQHGLNRAVAIKIVPVEPGRADRLLRLRLEAEWIARLAHPNIIAIHEIGESAGMHYLVLEYAEGGSLDNLFQQPPLAPREAAALVLPIARAIHAAHQAGVVHRDLKPANVLRMADGTPKVTDFGLAKPLDSAAELTQSGSVVGTPAYMSPEQANGQTQIVGPGVDVYGLGAILYALVTGRPPFETGNVLLTLEAVRHQLPVPASRWNRAVPRDLEVLIAKCLEKEPERRYASAAALADDLERFLEGKPIQARPARLATRLVSLARRRPTLMASWVLGGLVAILALTAGGLTWSWHVSEKARDEAQEARERAVEARDQAESAAQREAEALRELSEVLNINRVQLARQQIHESSIGRARENLAACDPLARNWEWHFTHRQATPAWEHTFADQRLKDVLFTPQGEVLVAQQGGIIARLDGQGNPRGEMENSSMASLPSPQGTVATAQAEAPTFNLCLGPEGQTVWSTRGHGILAAWDLRTGKKQHQQPLLSGNSLSHLALHPLLPDTVVSLYGGNVFGGGISLVNRHTGKDGRFLPGNPQSMMVASCFSRDGSLLTTTETDGSVQVWSVPDYKPLHALRDHVGPVPAVVAHPTRPEVATGGNDGRVNLWEAKGGKRLRSVSLPTGVTRLAWSADGTLLAAGLEDGSLWMIRGEEVVRLGHAHSGNPVAVAGLSFRPDGLALASASVDGSVKLWILADAGEMRKYEYPLKYGKVEAIQHSTKQVFCSELSGRFKRYDLASGAPVALGLPDTTYFQVQTASQAAVVAAITRNGELWVEEAPGIKPRLLGTLQPGSHWLAIDATGTLAITMSVRNEHSHLVGWNLLTGEQRWESTIEANLGGLVLDEAGRGFWIQGLSYPPSCHDARTGAPRWNRPDLPSKTAVFSADGERVLSLTEAGLHVLDAATGKTTLEIPFVGSSMGAFSRDKTRLFVTTWSKQLMVIDAKQGRVVMELNMGQKYLTRLIMGPDETLYAFSAFPQLLQWKGKAGGLPATPR